MRAGSQRLFGIVLLTILFAATTYADTFTFSTIPADGNLSAAAGSTVGWGYSVTNDSPDRWLVFNNVNTDSGFTNGTADATVFNSPIVAPHSTLTQEYDGFSGLYAFRWLDDATAGSSNSGNFILSAEWWSVDPFGEIPPDMTPELIPDFMVPYSVTIPVSCECTPVPEASSLVMLACGVGSLLLFNFNRKKHPLGL